MNRKLAGGLAVVVVLLAAWWFGFHRRHKPGAAAPPAAAAAAKGIATSVARPESHETGVVQPRGGIPRWSFDVDPVGPLRLEGQVLAADGGPVGGATVWLDSAPPRST